MNASNSRQFLVNPALCTACRSCEIACHFHHTATFGTVRSSVRIRYEPAASGIEIRFLPSCDQCGAAALPACVEACAPGALRVAPVATSSGADDATP